MCKGQIRHDKTVDLDQQRCSFMGILFKAGHLTLNASMEMVFSHQP